MSTERAVLEIAERQHAVVGTRQIRELGGDRFWIARQIKRGRWERPASRVVRVVGSPKTPEQQLMISVLQAGPTGMAAHEAAAWIWRVPTFSKTDVVLRGRSHGARALEGHRPTLVLPHHRTIVRGIPCTTLPRTIFDLAALGLPVPKMKRIVQNITTKSPAMLPALHRMLDELACRGRPGITTMRDVLAQLPIGEEVPASGLEARFEEICVNAGIRELERQLDIGGHSWLGRVDYVIRSLRLPIEVDSKLHHSSPLDVANDEERDAEMVAAGWRKPVRIEEEDVWGRPWRALNKLRAAIREAAAELGPKTSA